MPEPEPCRRAASCFSCGTTLLAIAAVIVVLVVGGVLVFGSEKRVAVPAGASRDDKAISSTTGPRRLHSRYRRPSAWAGIGPPKLHRWGVRAYARV